MPDRGVDLVKRISQAECLAILEAVASAAIRHSFEYKLKHVARFHTFHVSAFDDDADKFKIALPSDVVLFESIEPRAARMTLKY